MSWNTKSTPMNTSEWSIVKDHIKVNNIRRIRLVPITGSLKYDLRKYAALNKIAGSLFNYSYDMIYQKLKNLASVCKVNKSKVSPQAFRHYFGFQYINSNGERKFTELADTLGHTSIETTRIYTCGTLVDVKKSMEEM